MLPEKLILEAEEEQDKGIKTYQKKRLKAGLKVALTIRKKWVIVHSASDHI